MKDKVRELAYLVTCYNHVRGLLHASDSPWHQTPAQAARARRWRAVLRALTLDIDQLRATLPYATQLVLEPHEADGRVAYEWVLKQGRAYSQEGLTDPLNVSVEGFRPSAGEGA